jgi:hypothetical protein
MSRAPRVSMVSMVSRLFRAVHTLFPPAVPEGCGCPCPDPGCCLCPDPGCCPCPDPRSYLVEQYLHDMLLTSKHRCTGALHTAVASHAWHMQRASVCVCPACQPRT